MDFCQDWPSVGLSLHWSPMDEAKIVQSIVELKDDVQVIKDEMMTQKDKRELMTAIANLTSIVEKIRDDQVFTIEWIKRLQNQVDDQQKVIDQQAEEIRQIKLHLKLA